jgi:hypothetical protein
LPGIHPQKGRTGAFSGDTLRNSAVARKRRTIFSAAMVYM